MKQKRIKSVFYTLMALFILLVSYLAVPFPQSLKQALFPFAAVFAFVFFILGAVLVFLAAKSRLQKKLKIFLILTGASAAGFLPSVLLHNLLYGLLIYLFGEGFWSSGDEPFFFILATIICPVIFLVGSIGSAVMLAKGKKRQTKK